MGDLATVRAHFREPRLTVWKPAVRIERRAAGIMGWFGYKQTTYEEQAGWQPLYIEPPYALRLNGKEAISTWRRLRSRAEGSGYWPIVCGDEDEAIRLFENLSDTGYVPEPPKRTLEQATQVAVREFFARRKSENNQDEELQASLHGDWPNQVVQQGFVLPFDILTPTTPKDPAILALVPAQSGAEVPATLSYGGWNECPYPHEHVAVMRYWAENWGAELVGMSGEVVEIVAQRRPSSRTEAMALAEEHFLYCEDIVTQGTQTLENLAATLMAQDNWYFWWD